MKAVYVYLVGTAGSGKSSFTYAIKSWLNGKGLDCITVNLDPGVEMLPYTPDVDIRDWVSLTDVMEEYSLGPNGAQIVSADLVALKIDDVKKVLEGYDTDYVLIDTPGQLELFSFRESSGAIVSALHNERSCFLFMMDPVVAKTPMGFTSLLMLSASVQFRFMAPFVNVLAKVDLLTDEEIEAISSWNEDIDVLDEGLAASAKEMQLNLGLGLYRMLDELGLYRKLIHTSAETFTGVEDVYDYIQEVFAGGEDLYSD